MFFTSLILAMAGGAALATQGPTNATLARHIGNLEATTFNFTVGASILAIMTLIAGSGDLSHVTEVNWWQLLGGPYGVCVVLSVTFSVPILGTALTSATGLFGQVLMGMIIDSYGLFLSPKLDISTMRVAGCAIVLTGIILVYLGNRQKGNLRDRRATAVALLASFLAGGCAAAQSPTNASLAQHVGNFEASFCSFLGGLVFIATITLIVRHRHFNIYKPKEIKPWMLVGGLYGGFAVFANTVATPYLGVALLVAAIMLGQLSWAMVIDALGLIRAKKQPANPFRVCGILIILLGVAFITIDKVIL